MSRFGSSKMELLDDHVMLLVLAHLLWRHRSSFANTCKVANLMVREALGVDLSLDKDQLAAFLSAMSGDNCVITGGAGTGKSYLLKLIKKHLPEQGLMVTASTGCAAANVGAVTLHSALGMGVAKMPSHIIAKKIVQDRGYQCALCHLTGLKTLIIDEAFMLTAALFQKAGEILTLVRRGQFWTTFNPNALIPFDDVQIILVGDPLQLAPVQLEEEGWLWKSQAFKQLQTKSHVLKTVHRQQGDVPFIQILQRVRMGKGTQRDLDYLLFNSAQTPPPGALRLFSLNRAAEEYNYSCLAQIDASYHVFYALDSCQDERMTGSLFERCTAPEKLILKEGARVICLQNLQEARAFNGSLGLVRKIDVFHVEGAVHHVNVTVEFDRLVGEDEGRPRSTYTFKTHIRNTEVAQENLFTIEAPNGVKVAQRIQLPLKLAYGISIHKSQGSVCVCVSLLVVHAP